MSIEKFDYVARYKIPGVGTYYISKGPFMSGDDPALYRCWQNGGELDLKSTNFADIRLLLQVRIEEDLQYNVTKLLNELTEVNKTLMITKQGSTSNWLADFTIFESISR